MKNLLVLIIIASSMSIWSQNDFDKQFCKALKDLAKNVKKGKIQRVAYNDTTYQISGKLRGVEQSVATNYKFMKDQPLLMSNYGTPMSGKNNYVDEFQMFIGSTYVKLSDEKTQETLTNFMSNFYNAINDCNCKIKDNATLPVKFEKDKLVRLKWDCGKQGEVSLVYSTYGVSDEVSEFISYLNFNLIKY